MDIDIGIGKRARRSYELDDLTIVPSRRTRNRDEVDLSWQMDAFKFVLPMLAAPADSVTSPEMIIRLGEAGGLGVLDLEGLWTRHGEADTLLDKVLTSDEPAEGLRRLYEASVDPGLVEDRVRQLKKAGGVVAGALTPANVSRFSSHAIGAGLDILVIHGAVVSAEHVSDGDDVLDLREFIAGCEVPVIVGGCSAYSTALHLMRTGAVAVLVGVGTGRSSRTSEVLGVGVPLATAVADAAGARIRYLDETGRYVHIIAQGDIVTGGHIATAVACGADAVMLGAPFARALEAPGGGRHWDTDAFHAELPRSLLIDVDDRVPFDELLFGPSLTASDGRNLVGALRTVMGFTGHSNLKGFQKAEVMVRR
ncbi:MAG: GuaB3 family IMP dehydrogenase-related protein [Acidimicrobiia bacterium]|nr:GuaB3 family IMP dehydrogenase-related protein [Acidimicrobiia bacterium]